jgi:AcrR family transcriptional regulator
MTRPQTITNEEILAVARQLFLEKGLAATTAEIARQAGISEGTIFKRFPTKNELFFAAVGIKDSWDWGRMLDDLPDQDDVHDTLLRLTSKLIEFFRELVPRVMLLSSHRGTPPHAAPFFKGQQSPALRNHQALILFFEREIDRGRINGGDPQIMARLLVAGCWNYVFNETIGCRIFPAIEEQRFARGLVQTLWQGLEPRQADPRSKRRSA